MGYENYARTDIETSDPRAVVVLLYEGAIKFSTQALELARKSERREMSKYIQKAQKIVQFLMTSLDFDAGGEVADNLNSLYGYMRDTLSQANLKADPEKIEEVIGLLKPLLEAWRDIAKDPKAAEALANHPPRVPAQSSFEISDMEVDAQANKAYPTHPSPPAPQQAADPNASDEKVEITNSQSKPQTDESAKPSKANSNSAAARAAYGL